MALVAAFFGEGFEEVEALAVIDLLRRAKVSVSMVSITGNRKVVGSHNIPIETDELIEDVDFTKVDMIFLPGGMPGTKNLAACKTLTDQILDFNNKGKYLAAICAAPTVFGGLGILKGRKACCYPGMEDGLTGAQVTFDKVTIDDYIYTSRGMGTAMDLGLALVAKFAGEDVSENLAKAVVYR